MNLNHHNLFERIRNAISVARYGDFKKFVQEEAEITYRNYIYVVKAEVKKPNIKVLQAIALWFECSIEQVLDPNYILQDNGAIKSKSAQDSSLEDELARKFDLKKEAA